MLKDYITNTIERLIAQRADKGLSPLCITRKELDNEISSDTNDILNDLYFSKKIKVGENVNKEKLIFLYDTTTQPNSG